MAGRANGNGNGNGGANGAATWESHDLEALFQRDAGELRAYACGVLRDRRDHADDVVQQAFLNVAVAARSGTEIRDSRRFLYRVVRNLCIDVLRDREVATLDAISDAQPCPSDVPGKRAASGDGGCAAAVPTEGDAGAMAERVDLSVWLERAVHRLGELPERQRRAFALTQLRGLSHEEAATVLATNPNSLRQLVHRARTALREIGLPAMPPALTAIASEPDAIPAAPTGPEPPGGRLWPALRNQYEALAARGAEKVAVLAAVVAGAVCLPQVPALLEGGEGDPGGDRRHRATREQVAARSPEPSARQDAAPAPRPRADLQAGALVTPRREPGDGREVAVGVPGDGVSGEPIAAAGSTGPQAVAQPASGAPAAPPSAAEQPGPEPLDPADALREPIPGDGDPQQGSGSAGTSAGHSAGLEYDIDESGVSLAQSAGGPVSSPDSLPRAWASYDGTTIGTPGDGDLDRAAEGLLERFERTTAELAAPVVGPANASRLQPLLPSFRELFRLAGEAGGRQAEQAGWSDSFPVPAVAPPSALSVSTDQDNGDVEALVGWWLDDWGIWWLTTTTASQSGTEIGPQLDGILEAADRLAAQAAPQVGVATGAQVRRTAASSAELSEYLRATARRAAP